MRNLVPVLDPATGVAPGAVGPALRPDEVAAVRQFCLDTIQEAFGHGYRADWHGDLDRLGSADDDYTPNRGGAFLVIRHEGAVVACGGLRPLSAKPILARQFESRYPDPAAVGSLWRVYVQPELRSQGLGRALSEQLEAIAAAQGYRCIYLHTSARRPAAVRFWERQGYRAFCRDLDDTDATLHLDKKLPDQTRPDKTRLDLDQVPLDRTLVDRQG